MRKTILTSLLQILFQNDTNLPVKGFLRLLFRSVLGKFLHESKFYFAIQLSGVVELMIRSFERLR